MANIYNEYFYNQEKYVGIYGKSTIFFMQIGSFFEAYQTHDEGYDLQILSNILNIIVSKKDKSVTCIDRKNPYMMGFPCISLQKFIKILIDNNYTIIIMEQILNLNPKQKKEREVTAIYSPSTYINEISKPDSNYLLTIILEENIILNSKSKKVYVAGLSLIEPSTGYIKIHETLSSINDEKISLDEIVKFINSFNPSEIFLITSNITSGLNDIICYLELSNKNYIHKTLENVKSLQGYSNFQQISYQTDLLKKIYHINSSPIDLLNLEKMTLGRDAFILSLLYLSDHNSNLLTNISRPEIYIKEDKMHLGNNPIMQLDIFPKDDKNFYSIDNSYKSLFDIINQTVTPMGRRFLKNALIEPLILTNQINTRYDIIEYLQKNHNQYDDIISSIKDTERLDRKINLKNIHPIEFYQWIQFQESSLVLLEKISNNKILTNLLNIDNKNKISKIQSNLLKMIKYIKSVYKIDELEKYLINDITGNIFIEGKNKNIDELQNNIDSCRNFMTSLATILNTILGSKIDKHNKNDLNYDQLIKVESNERDGYFLVLSNKRADILKEELDKKDLILVGKIKIKSSAIKFIKPLKGSNSKIFCNEIKDQSDKINDYLDEMKTVCKELYISELGILIENYEDNIKVVSGLIALFDFLLSGAKVANKFFYNKPIINNKFESKSYFIADKLRHPIIERINLDSEFIPINIQLGTGTSDIEQSSKQDGILLFGLNSAGKSTLQKAIGISILMAQIGYFVPATSFEYYPYNSIFTRISANDNLFKGLSAFTLELAELTAILKRNTKNTLIIADEICKGTEHKSSLIIVMTIIKMLSESETSFITATHLHELGDFKELKELKNVNKYHLHVEYDEVKNKLIYDRTLREGSGSSFYGLIVAKCLINDIKFSDYANQISKNIKTLDISSDKKSKYNSQLYLQSCAVCSKSPIQGEIPLETHHINFQKDCDSFGLIKSKKHLHKNHLSNLVVLCSKCHDNIDRGLIQIDKYNDTLNGRELNIKYKYNLDDLERINNDITKKIRKTLENISYI